MRSKRSKTTSRVEGSVGVAQLSTATTIHSKETQTLQQVQIEHARARALGRALADATNEVALHQRPTLLLPTISASDRVEETSDEISAELVVEPQDGLAEEVVTLRRERDELYGRVATLQKELATEREQRIDQQREMELLLPWLPTSDEAPFPTVSCSEVLKRIEPLRELIKRANSPSGRMSDQDKVRWLLIDAESVVTELRKLCGEN